MGRRESRRVKVSRRECKGLMKGFIVDIVLRECKGLMRRFIEDSVLWEEDF